MTPVPRELIEALAGELPKTPAAAPANGDHRNGAGTWGGRLSPPSVASAVARCRAYVRKVGPAISGQYGHNATFKAARIVWNDFGLNFVDGYPILEEFNRTCDPPWSEHDLKRKWNEAMKKGPGPDGRGFKVHERSDQPHPLDRGDAWEPPGPHDISFDPAEIEGKKEPEPRFRFLTADEFAAGDFKAKWFVEGVLVEGEPAVIAGLSKTLKTSIGVDLCISIAAGKPFLGKFRATRRARVAIVSGESGKSTLQDVARRIAQAKGIEHADLKDWLHWSFDIPVLPDLAGMAEFTAELAERSVELVLIDPLYLAMGDVDMRSMFEAGAALRTVVRMLLDRGITVVLLHHANRQTQTGEPMELTNIAYSGVDQFARQFMLISRRERYEGGGVHEMWVQIGGSAFTGHLWGVDIDEGQADENFQGRRWEVGVFTREELKTTNLGDRESRQEESARQRMQADDTAVLNAIDAERQSGRPGATMNAVRTRYPKMSATRVKEAMTRLHEAGVIEPVDFKIPGGNGAKQKVSGYRRSERVERSEFLPFDPPVRSTEGNAMGATTTHTNPPVQPGSQSAPRPAPRYAVMHRPGSVGRWAKVGGADTERAAWSLAFDLMGAQGRTGGDWRVDKVASTEGRR